MSQSELIADRIEEAISRMFYSFSEYDPKVSEYSIYYDPKKHSSWFIELYFSDNNQLGTAIDNGTCYEVQDYLYNDFDNLNELKSVERQIYFESGNRPANEVEYHIRHHSLIEKSKYLTKSNNEVDPKICHCCGHDFDKHQLKGFTNEETNTLTKGWITCPVENCNCFLTWGVNYNEDSNKS